MSRADELFSRYGSAGTVEVEGYDLSDIVRRPRKEGPKLNQNLGNQTILNQPPASSPESSEQDEILESPVDSDSGQIRLAFAFQSKGWTGTLMDRLNTFSYKDLFRRRIAKVKSRTADIRQRVDGIKPLKTDVEDNE